MITPPANQTATKAVRGETASVVCDFEQFDTHERQKALHGDLGFMTVI